MVKLKFLVIMDIEGMNSGTRASNVVTEFCFLSPAVLVSSNPLPLIRFERP